MAKQVAKVIERQGRPYPNGRERIAEIRLGAKGEGQRVGSVVYWPWSDKSCEQADRIIAEIAERNDLELTYAD